MGKIPVITTQVSSRSGRPNGGLIGTRSTAADFGGEIGGALQTLAGGVDNLAAGLDAYKTKRTQEEVANKVALSDYTPRELAIRNSTPADGSGYYKAVSDDYTAYVDEQADGIDDPVARKEYKQRMLAQKPNIQSRSAQYEFTLAATNSKEQAGAALSSLQNKVTTDPTMYDAYLEQGNAVIDARPGLSASLKEGMKLKWKQDSANSRFTGMLENAKSVEDIDAISNELAGKNNAGKGPDERKDWASQFLPQDYERMMNTIGNTRKAFITKADTDARAAIDTIQDRAKDVNTLLPQDELREVQKLAKASQNPITVARMARIMRDEDIKREERGLPPSELRARQNEANGNPGIAYPGLPPRLSSAVNNASSKFDVSASYLGATAQREYGKYLKVQPTGNPQFKPVGVHAGVDFRNMRSDTVDMLTVAGEIMGRPLQVTSGYRSQDRQDAIRNKPGMDPNRVSVAKDSAHTHGTGADISTVGMSAAQKAQLAGALVDAGATGIGEYDTHMHADLRAAVPSSFGKDSPSWGGWTNLSPEVMQTLKDRGFAAGLSSEQIKRSRPVASADSIDYGRGADGVKDDGRPVSSAVGVGQFTEGTFIDTMRKPGIAARMGIDVSTMTDAQLLNLRKDPDVSMMAAAALGEQNKITLERSLGRRVSDPELYMAHFLGAGGAMALLNGMKNKPDQSAASLLPDAAASNRNVFYDKGKALTVQQVYTRIADQFGNQPSQVAFGDNETRQRIIVNAEKQLKDDPMTYATQSGKFNGTSLDDDNGFNARGQEARSVADYYNIPVSDMKPFTEQESADLHKKMKDGSVDDVLNVMSQIQAMGGDMATAALKQLDQKDSVYAFAAGLQFDRGNTSVASDIVRGQKRLEENPAIKTEIGAQDRDLSDAFTKATGGSLYEVSPRQRQAIQEAAFAHYVETYGTSGTKGFDATAFGNSVQAVLGGTKGSAAIDDVNGQPTVLPKGLTGDVIEQAFQRMTVDDWAKLSTQKLPPRYVNGDVIDPADLADEATMRTIGGGKYKIMLGDGSFAVTGQPGANGRLEAYVFAPDEKTVKDIASRPIPEPAMAAPGPRQPQVNANGTITIDEQTRVREQYGALYNFDENGLWIGPAGGKK